MDRSAAAGLDGKAGALFQRDLVAEKTTREAIAAPAPRAGYRPDIDGLRAIAVTSVVFFHAGLWPFRSGFVGVDIFFVISGYLIGGIMLRDMARGTFSFANFYARRARRILPALSVVVLSTCLAGWYLLDASEYKDVGVVGALALVGASNINFWQFQDYFASDARLRILLMTWSLGVEEQFYLLSPFVIMAIQRFARSQLIPALAAGCLASLIVSLVWTWSAPEAAFYLLPARAWELGAGVTLAAIGSKRGVESQRDVGPSRLLQDLLALGGLLALCVGIVAFDERTPFPGLLALLPVMGTTILLLSQHSWVNRKLLSSRPAVFVGMVSYSWYLWHWPMMSMMRNVIPIEPRTSALAGAVFLSFVMAIASWWCIERPFRRNHLTPQTALVRYAFSVLIVGAVPLSISASGGVASRLSPKTRDLEAAVTASRRKSCLVMAGSALIETAICRVAPEGHSVIAIVGDSHAWAVAPGLRKLADEQGLGSQVFARALCPPLLGVTIRASRYPDLKGECATFKAATLSNILSNPRFTTVVLVGSWSGAFNGHGENGYASEDDGTTEASDIALLRKGLERTISALTAGKKRVLILQDVPRWSFDPLKIALDNSMPVRDRVANFFDPDVRAMSGGSASLKRLVNQEQVRQVISELANVRGHVEVSDPKSSFCDQKRCVFERDGSPLFFDDNHVTPLGSIVATQELKLSNP